MPLFDTIVEGIAKLMGLEPARARDAREHRQLRSSTSVEREPARERERERASEEPEPAEEPEPSVESELEPVAEPEPDPALEQLLEAAMGAIPKVVAVAAVDIEQGRLLATRFETPLDPEVEARLAGATRELLGAPYFAAVEASLGSAEVEAGAQRDVLDFPARQVIVLSTNLVHLFVRLEQYPNLVLAVVCRANTNLGLTLARLRSMSA